MPDEATTPPLVGQAELSLPVIGDITILWSSKGLVRLAWGGAVEPGIRIYKRPPAKLVRPLKDYARGRDVDLAAVPVDLRGTAFQRAVWNALRAVPRGRLRTYAGIALDVGRPRAMRAVGAANGKNPVPIVVPCHRIVGAGHKLGGYSGGLDRKRALLRLEGVRIEGEQLRPGQLSLFD
ncbi:MAG: methylated-DNA--[protein]-cysteine S-methyltransferase [Myxococcota bacterium]